MNVPSSAHVCYRDSMFCVNRHVYIALPALVAAWLVAGPCAHAMVVVERDFPQLVARAEQIVVGTVTSVTEAPDTSGAPCTWVTFSDLSVLKGEVGSTLTLRFYGVAAGGTVTRIPDMPTFAVGDRAVLFVAGNGRDVCPLVGVWQGRFRVRFDAQSGTEVVETNDGKPVVELAGGQPRAARARAEVATAAPMTLDEFRQRITDELLHPTTSPPPNGTPPR
jgi:hypothetical protein